MIVLLLILVAALVVLPYLPAILELAQARDAEPLEIGEDYEEDMRNWPQRFFREVVDFFDREDDESIRSMALAPPSASESQFRVVGSDTKMTVDDLAKADRPILFVADTPAELADDVQTNECVYTGRSLLAGVSNRFTQIYAGGDVKLGGGSAVSQWVRCHGNVSIGERCSMDGSVNADGRVTVALGTAFERIQGAQVDFVESVAKADEFANRPDAFAGGTRNGTAASLERSVVNGDYELSEGSDFSGNLVVKGDLVIGRGSVVAGSIKATGDLTLLDDVVVQGHVFSAGSISLGNRCKIRGLLNAEGDLRFGEDCQIGATDVPTTVSADRIIVSPHLRVYGTIWANTWGTVEYLPTAEVA